MNPEEKKDLHMKQAGEYIGYLNEYKEKIHDDGVKQKVGEFTRTLTDIRDLQYWFDSGEKELDRLYERYMPYLNTILENYLKLETSWNFSELERVRGQLQRTLDQFIDTLKEIARILPQDEIDAAEAEAKAQKMKEELDRQYRMMYEKSN